MAGHKSQFRLCSMCRVLRIERSGYYAWKVQPKSRRTLTGESRLASIKRSFDDSQEIYGSPRVHCDLHEESIGYGRKRVARLMRQSQLRSVHGYKRPRFRAGMPSTTAPHRTAPNQLQREFTVALPDQVGVTDITYIRACMVPESGDLIARPVAHDLAVLGFLATPDGVPRRKR